MDNFPRITRINTITYLILFSAVIASLSIISLTSGHLIGAAPFVLGALFFYSLAFYYYPKQSLLIFTVYVLFQDIIAINIARIFGSPILEGFKNIDEVTILFSFMILVLQKKLSIRKPLLDYPLLGILTVGAISSFLNHAQIHIVGFGAFLIIKGFLVFYIFSNIDFQETDIKKYIRVFGVIAFLFLFAGVIDFIAPQSLRSFLGNNAAIDYRFGIASVQSFFTHPGEFAWFMAFISLYAFAFYFVYGQRRYLILALLFSVTSFFSMRRKQLAGIMAAISGGVLNLPLSRKVKTGIPAMMILGIAFTAAFPIIIQQFNNLLESYVNIFDPMKNARNALYITSGQIAIDNFPFGAGFGRFGGWISRLYYSPVYREYGLLNVYGMSEGMSSFLNDTFWPHILGELGIIGFVLYFVIISRLLSMSWRASRLLSSPAERAFALGTMMILLEALAESIAQPVFEKPPEIFFIFGSLGITFSLYNRRQKVLPKLSLNENNY